MFTRVICIGLWTTPFIFWSKINIYDIKEYVAAAFSLALCFFILYSGKVKPFRNKWLFLFLGWGILNIAFMPNFKMYVLGQEVVNFWVWKAAFINICYALGVIAVASYDFNDEEINTIKKTIVYAGFAMSLYMIAQKFGLDQFFGFYERNTDIPSIQAARIGGFLGHPTLAAAYLAVCFPFAILHKNKLFCLFIIIGICLAQSIVAIAACAIGLLWICLYKLKFINWFVCGCALAAIITTPFFLKIPEVRSFIEQESNGRISEWKKIVLSWKETKNESTQKNTITGFGAGTFKYVYAPLHESRFRQAHNEYLELLYNYGLGGLILFLLFLLGTLKRAVYGDLSFMTSFIIVCLMALGAFVFQMGAVTFYSVIIFGILNKELPC